jgi:hypothetical protein
MLPVENLADMKMKTVSEKDLVNHGDLFGKAFEGRPEQSEGAFVLKQWERSYCKGRIGIYVSLNSYCEALFGLHGGVRAC